VFEADTVQRSTILSGRVEFIDENDGRSAFAFDSGNKKEAKSYVGGRRFFAERSHFFEGAEAARQTAVKLRDCALRF
jgi:hypothetical protein